MKRSPCVWEHLANLIYFKTRRVKNVTLSHKTVCYQSENVAARIEFEHE